MSAPKPLKEKRVPKSISLPGKVWDELDEAAPENERSRYVQQVLEEHFTAEEAKNISLPPKVFKKALQTATARGYKDFSQYAADLFTQDALAFSREKKTRAGN